MSAITPNVPKTCPNCGAPLTIRWHPSRRWHYECGSYLFDGQQALHYASYQCGLLKAINHASQLLADIMHDTCNAQDAAEKWLREYAPQYLQPFDTKPLGTKLKQ
jgi:hypothetical protein